MQTCVQFRSFSHPTCWFELLRMENRNWGGGVRNIYSDCIPNYAQHSRHCRYVTEDIAGYLAPLPIQLSLI